MKKLALQLDALQLDALHVESFATSEAHAEARGTVRGFATVTCPAEPQPDTVKLTAWATCAYTCDDATCVGSCQGTSCYPPACGTCDSYAGGACGVPTRVCTL